jgi:EAL domain-containing protein (putative c-di-GMP-specific phosphodiesterase class I)
MRAGKPKEPLAISRAVALKVAAFYVLLSSLWIVVSDGAVYLYGEANGLSTAINMGKGLLYVLVTAGVLFLFMIGIAIYPDDGGDPDTLLRQANAAMRHAKEAGRNTYRFFAERMNVDADEYLSLLNGLRRALDRDEFVLHYQPQIALASGRVVGAEALIRWHHPDLGLVPPGKFISIAEESGLIVEIGDWVLRQACRQAAHWHRAGVGKLVVAVNLSVIQFKRGGLVDSVGRALAESGLEPSCLELELTESILIRDTANVLATVRQLKGLGVKLSIDDFGTGYSSLAYLRLLDLDKLKIDRSFVHDVANSRDNDTIVKAIVQLAQGLSLRTIAEGVENPEDLDVIRRHGCDEVQGYHFAEPMPAAEFARYLSASGLATEASGTARLQE